MKILLVDDSFAMRRIEKNILGKIGYTDIEEAGDGAEALAKLKAGKFDLVLMDWNMPNVTGFEALKTIKSMPELKSIPVVMITSEAEKSRVIEALQAGAAGYIVKPFDPDQLMQKISSMVGK